MTTLRFKAPPTVARMMASDAFVRVVVGPIGSGKSSGCVTEILRRAATQRAFNGVRSTRWAVIRNSFPQLRDTTQKTFEQWVPGALGKWHRQPFIFEIDRKLNDGTRMKSEILFRALDSIADVGKVLSLELTGAYFNELREIPKEIFDAVQGRVGRFPSQAHGGPSWSGVFGDSNPWATSSWGYQLFSKDRPPGFELFEQPGGRSPHAENVENLPPGYYERLCHGKDASWVSEYVDGEYPSADKGSIYGDWLDALERKGSIGTFEHPSDGVHITLDLGVSDATAIWWWRINTHGMPDLIDYYEATGKGASHFFQVIRERGWKWNKIWLPHDARQRSFQTGISTIEQWVKEFGMDKVSIGPELSVDDGIAAVRWMLEQPMRIHARCDYGLKMLRAYRFVWDEVKKVFAKKPEHNMASHAADSCRYIACVALDTANKSRQNAPVKPFVYVPPKITLDGMFDTGLTETRDRRKGRI